MTTILAECGSYLIIKASHKEWAEWQEGKARPTAVPIPFSWQAWPTDHIKRPNGRSPINQQFGANPKSYARFKLPGHEGVDFYLREGDHVYAVGDGKVYRTHHQDSGRHNYGNHLRIEHKDGYKTIYCHLSEILVSVGDDVSAGDLIGTGGSTGNSTGAHLHLTMKRKNALQNGYPYNIIDPSPFMWPLYHKLKNNV